MTQCREPAFLVFSNCDEILVIMPSAATKDSRDSTCGMNHFPISEHKPASVPRSGKGLDISGRQVTLRSTVETPTLAPPRKSMAHDAPSKLWSVQETYEAV